MLGLYSLFFIVFVYGSVSVLSAPEPVLKKAYYDLDRAKELFGEFIKKYDKAYEHAEYVRRLKIFEDNLAKYNEWNRVHSTAVFGVGPYADMSLQEFFGTYTIAYSNFSTSEAVVYKPTGNAPESLDWRDSNYVTEVKNQGQCGSCYVFSAIGNIEGLYAKLTGQLISLSEQQGLDCNPNDCKGGWPDAVMNALAEQSGSMRESDYPYSAAKQQCRTDASKIVVKVTGGSQLQVSSEEDLKDALANYGPLSVVIAVPPEMPSLLGGVIDPTSCDNNSLHAIVLIGYGTEGGVPYWLFKNSWGANWNEQGFFRMVRGKSVCQIGQYVASATVSA